MSSQSLLADPYIPDTLELATGLATLPAGGLFFIFHAYDRGVAAALSPQGNRQMGLTAGAVYRLQLGLGGNRTPNDILAIDDCMGEFGSLGLGGGYAGYRFVQGWRAWAAKAAAAGRTRAVVPSPWLFAEYMRFRNQGFTAAQAWYLAQPYQGLGHHFPIPQRMARSWGLPDWLRDSRFNVLIPKGISRGRFYELHYMVDPYYHYSPFPRAIGGGWSGRQLGLQRYSSWTRWWYATPGPTKVVGGGLILGGAAGWYWLFDGCDEE